MARFSVMITVLFFLGCSDSGDPKAPENDAGASDISLDRSADMGRDFQDTSGQTSDVIDDIKNDPSTDLDVIDDIKNEPDMEIDFGDWREFKATLRTQTQANHNPLGYKAARVEMYKADGIDAHEGRIEAIYTGRSVKADGSNTPSTDCKKMDGSSVRCSLNTEHSFPQFYLRKHLGKKSTEFNAAKGDIHHLFPSDRDVNGRRGHLGYGDTDCDETSTCKVNEESRLGIPVGKDGDTNCNTSDPKPGEYACVMQVRDLRKGDVARAQFYMALRYDMQIPDDSEAVMKQWNRDDPPDTREKTRNEHIESAQGNRNPFVDNPSFVDRIKDF